MTSTRIDLRPRGASRPWSGLLVLGAALIFGAGCEEEGGPAPECVALEGGCAGVSEPSLGSGDFYLEGATCGRVWYARAGAAAGGDGSQGAPFGDLPEAAAAAAAGDCIALAKGTYQGATLPGSVSLLGRGSGRTTVGPLTVNGGSDALIRGVRVTGQDTGIAVLGAAGLTVSQVLVEQTAGVGIWLQEGGGIALLNVRIAEVTIDPTDATPVGNGLVSAGVQELTVEQLLVEGCAGSGLIHFGGNVSVSGSVIRDNQGYGVAVGCRLSGTCAASPEARVEGNLIAGNAGVGLWLSEVEAVVTGNTVTGTTRGSFGISRNVEAAVVPSLLLEDNRVEAGEGFGILLHETSGALARNTVAQHGGRGIWVQSAEGGSGVTVGIADTVVRESVQVGIGALGPCEVTIEGGQVADTQLGFVLVNNATVEQGDGVQAVLGPLLTVVDVLFQGNARVSVMADLVGSIDVQGSTFEGTPTEGAIVISRTDAGLITTSANLGAGGVAVAPVMPPDPLDYDGEPVVSAAVAF